MDSLCRARNKIMNVLSWRFLPVLTRLLLWRLIPSLLRNSGNKHQKDPLVSAETVRHESSYIIIFVCYMDFMRASDNIVFKSIREYQGLRLWRWYPELGTYFLYSKQRCAIVNESAALWISSLHQHWPQNYVYNHYGIDDVILKWLCTWIVNSPRSGARFTNDMLLAIQIRCNLRLVISQ